MQVPSNRPLRFLHLKFHATLHKYEYGLHSTYEHLQTTKLFKKSLFKIPYHQYYCIKKKQQPPLDTFSPSSNDGSSLLLDTINRVTRFSPIPSYFLPCVVRPIFANPTIFLGSSLSLFLLDDVKGSNLFPLIWKPFQGKNLCSKVVKGFETITPCNVQRPTKM